MTKKNYKINYQKINSNKNIDITDLNRPISPHLQIYKWEWTMAYSIAHRISAIGVGLSIILLVSLGFLLPYDVDIKVLVSDYIIGKIVYIAMLLCIGYYIFATIKYMIWGFGIGLDLKSAKLLGHISLVCTILFAIGVFCYGILS